VCGAAGQFQYPGARGAWKDSFPDQKDLREWGRGGEEGASCEESHHHRADSQGKGGMRSFHWREKLIV